MNLRTTAGATLGGAGFVAWILAVWMASGEWAATGGLLFVAAVLVITFPES